MPAMPPLLSADPVTGRVYIVTDYRLQAGSLTALDQTDVTEMFVAIVKYHAETGRLRASLTD